MSFNTGPNLIRDGLILYWDAANSKSYPGNGSTWTELTDLTYTGTLTNSPAFSSNTAKGSLVFDGTNDYVATNYTTPFGTSNLTIGIWFRFTATQLSALFSKRIGASSYEQLSIFISGDAFGNSAGTKIVINDFNNPASRNAITTGSYNDGLWHYLTLVRGSSDNKLYIDGILADTTTAAKPNLSSSSRLFIGVFGENQSVLGNYFNGGLSIVQVYNRALSLDEVTQNWNALKLRFGRLVGTSAGLDGDAQAFLNATGITDATISSAINTLVTNLKSYNIWTKMKAIYPFVGGTATTHKYNLKDPRDLDAAFRILFSGGWVHNSSGALSNGSNTTALTYVLGNTDISTGNAGMGIYSVTETINASAFGVGASFHIHVRFTNNVTYWRISDSSGFAANVGTSRGLFHGYSNAGNSSTAFFNGSLQNTFTGASSIAASYVYLSGGMPGYAIDNRQLAFAFVSQGLSNTEASNLYTAIQAFQTTLGRQV